MIRSSLPSLSPSALSLLGALCAVQLSACRNLDSFDSKPGEAYCGAISVQPAFTEGFQPSGQPPNLQLELTLDTSKISTEPGLLRSSDITSGLCSGERLFDKVPLRAIPEVEHDVLSTLSFGEGHEHDFFAWVDSSCQGTMLAVVSLLKNNLVEVRLFKPAHAPTPNAPPAEKPGFAVFQLDARKGGCGF